MTSHKRLKKIIWAIDAFSEDRDLHRKTLHILNTTAKGTAIIVQPVTVLTPEQLNIPIGLFEVHSVDAGALAQERMVKMVKGLRAAQVLAPKTIFSSDISMKYAVAALVNYAKREEFDLIAVSTHSRRAVTRFLFGSFAESLILQSDIPTLLVSPQMHELKRLSHILYPTDLSDASRETLESVVGFAKDRNASITLFHKIERVKPYSVPGFQVPKAFADILNQDLVEREKKLHAWVEDIRKLGIKIEAKWDEKSGRSVWESVIAVAKKMDAAIIAMAAHSDPLASVILGGTTRQIVRHAPCPIWILQPSPRGKKKEAQPPLFPSGQTLDRGQYRAH